MRSMENLGLKCEISFVLSPRTTVTMKLSEDIITIINLTFIITIVMTVIYYFHCMTNKGDQ